jgi:hypothetical protein
MSGGCYFSRGECTTLECPPETDLEVDDQCFEEVAKVPTCPTAPFTHLLSDNLCHPNNNLSSAGQTPVLDCPEETDLEQGGKCFVELEPEVVTTHPGRGNNPTD